MKKVVLVGIMFMMFMGVVSASSFNGEYEGSPIVKIINKGNTIDPIDVPAIIYKGRTMVPLSMLQSLGYEVAWNPKNYSVTVIDPVIYIEPTPTPIPVLKKTLSQISKEMKTKGIELISYMTDGEGIDTITYYTNFTSNEGLSKISEYNAILESGMNTDAKILEVYYTDKFAVTIPTVSIRDYKSGIITESQFIASQKANMPTAQSLQSTISKIAPSQQSNTSTTTTTLQSTPQPNVDNVVTARPKPDNTAQCQSIRDSYGSQIAMVGYEEGSDGSKRLKVLGLQNQMSSALSSAGC